MVIVLSTVTTRVNLFFMKVHSDPYKRLSRNVIREICAYLDTIFLPAVHMYGASEVFLHDLETETHISIPLSEQLPRGTAICLLGNASLLSVGGEMTKSVKQINFLTGAVRDEPSLKEGRAWAGVIRFGPAAMVFGGHFETPLQSCEAFSLVTRTWTQCPPMLSSKANFTPVEYRGEIYLPAPQYRKQQLEVFTPASLQYRLLPLYFDGNLYGSVSYLYEEELFMFTYAMDILAWKLESGESTPRVIGRMQYESSISYGRSMRVGNCEYWANFEGNLMKFDLKMKRLSEAGNTR